MNKRKTLAEIKFFIIKTYGYNVQKMQYVCRDTKGYLQGMFVHDAMCYGHKIEAIAEYLNLTVQTSYYRRRYYLKKLDL